MPYCLHKSASYMLPQQLTSFDVYVNEMRILKNFSYKE